MKIGQETISASSILRTAVSMTSFSSSISLGLSKLKPKRDVLVSGSIELASYPNGNTQPNDDKKSITRSTITSTSEYLASAYKLIDLGTAVAVHDAEECQRTDTLKTVTEMAFAGYDTNIHFGLSTELITYVH
jgi:hypothetical protein